MDFTTTIVVQIYEIVNEYLFQPLDIIHRPCACYFIFYWMSIPLGLID